MTISRGSPSDEGEPLCALSVQLGCGRRRAVVPVEQHDAADAAGLAGLRREGQPGAAVYDRPGHAGEHLTGLGIDGGDDMYGIFRRVGDAESAVFAFDGQRPDGIDPARRDAEAELTAGKRRCNALAVQRHACASGGARDAEQRGLRGERRAWFNRHGKRTVRLLADCYARVEGIGRTVRGGLHGGAGAQTAGLLRCAEAAPFRDGLIGLVRNLNTCGSLQRACGDQKLLRVVACQLDREIRVKNKLRRVFSCLRRSGADRVDIDGGPAGFVQAFNFRKRFA